ncbi:MAG: hypothetical protein WC656_05640 [Sulfurimonas sp.]|jgi:hypothetical protein
MKLKLILSLLFTIATIFSALHEVEHLKHHDSSTCQICIVDDHSVSADILNNFKENIFVTFDAIPLQKNQIQIPHAKKNTNHSNAPPLFS